MKDAGCRMQVKEGGAPGTSPASLTCSSVRAWRDHSENTHGILNEMDQVEAVITGLRSLLYYFRIISWSSKMSWECCCHCLSLPLFCSAEFLSSWVLWGPLATVCSCIRASRLSCITVIHPSVSVSKEKANFRNVEQKPVLYPQCKNECSVLTFTSFNRNSSQGRRHQIHDLKCPNPIFKNS